MKLGWILVFWFALVACTSAPAPSPVYVYVTDGSGAGGSGGGTTTESGGGTATTTDGSGGSGGAGGGAGGAPTGACYGYVDGQISACRQTLTQDECPADWLFSPDATCPTSNLVGCCYYALTYLCYYSPTFDADISSQCDGTWEVP